MYDILDWEYQSMSLTSDLVQVVNDRLGIDAFSGETNVSSWLHGVCPDLAGLGIRVVLRSAFPIKEHGRPLLQVISRPSRKFWGIGIALASKSNPGLLHLLGQLQPLWGIARHLLYHRQRARHEIPDKEPVHGMSRSAK